MRKTPTSTRAQLLKHHRLHSRKLDRLEGLKALLATYESFEHVQLDHDYIRQLKRTIKQIEVQLTVMAKNSI